MMEMKPAGDYALDQKTFEGRRVRASEFRAHGVEFPMESFLAEKILADGARHQGVLDQASKVARHLDNIGSFIKQLLKRWRGLLIARLCSLQEIGDVCSCRESTGCGRFWSLINRL